jgi:hypothetical protein
VTTNASESRSQAVKRKLDDSREQLSRYEELYRLLRTRKSPDVQEIIRGIRAGDDVETVVRHVQHGDLLLQMHVSPEHKLFYDFPDIMHLPSLFLDHDNPYMKSPTFQSSGESPQNNEVLHKSSSPPYSHTYEIPYHAAHIVDPRLEKVNASFWTNVTSDNSVVAKLISLYFLTEYPCYASFHKDLFLDDLVACRKTFCSSLLVNTICAAGMVCL